LIKIAVRNHSSRKKLFDLIFQTDDITFYYIKADPSLFNLWVEKNTQQIIKNKWLSQKEVFNLDDTAALLGVSPITLKKMAEKGLITPAPYTIANAKYLFHKSSITSFQETFSFIQEAAKDFKLSENQLRSMVRKGDIKNHFDGINKRHLIKKEDLFLLLSQDRRKY
jgi:hypothetical protein